MALAGWSAWGALPVRAQGPVVDIATDENDGECLVDCSLRDAIQTGNPGDVITFDADYAIYLNSVLAIDKKLTIDGSGQTITLSGDSGNNGSRDTQIFNIASTGVVTLSHLNVVSGTTAKGGGVYNAGILTVNTSTFLDNLTSERGGGIYNAGNLTVNNSTFTANESAGGGGVYCYSGSTTTIKTSTFSGNLVGENGGAIFNFSTKQTTVTDSSFLNNEASFDGGGIYNNGTAFVSNSTFYGNSTGNLGGGIYTDLNDNLTLKNSTFSNNSAGSGGGIINRSSGTLHMQNSLIANSAGGGDCVNWEPLPPISATWLKMVAAAPPSPRRRGWPLRAITADRPKLWPCCRVARPLMPGPASPVRIPTSAV